RLAAGRQAPGGVHELDVAVLSAAPRALRRFGVWQAMDRAAGGRPISSEHVQMVLDLLDSGRAGSLDAPGQHLERASETLGLTSRPDGTTGRWSASRLPNFFDVPLSIPGEVPIPLAGCSLSAKTTEGDAVQSAAVRSADVAAVRLDLCGTSLRVRNRR